MQWAGITGYKAPSRSGQIKATGIQKNFTAFRDNDKWVAEEGWRVRLRALLI